MIKEFMFGLWGALWVLIDEVRKALHEMSAAEFLRLFAKVGIYTLAAAGWVLIFLAGLVML